MINIALVIFSGFILYAEHNITALTPHGATLTNNAPGKSFGELKSNNKIPINIKIKGEITNFKIEIVVVSLLMISLLLKDKIIPIANKPTGEPQAVSLERV